MDIEKFVASRSPLWADLDTLVARAEEQPDELSHDDVHRLVELYRRACSDLNLARSYTANPELIGRLNQLTGRAYRFVYQAGHEKPVVDSFVRLVTREIPTAFRRERMAIAIAAAAEGTLPTDVVEKLRSRLGDVNFYQKHGIRI